MHQDPYDDQMGAGSQRPYDDSSSDDIPLDERCRAVASRLETVLVSTDGLGMVPKSCLSKDAVLQEGGRVARSKNRRFAAA